MNPHFLILLSAFFISITKNVIGQTINSEPSGAKVYFEGSYLGKTPLKLGATAFPYDLVYLIRRDKVDVSRPPYEYELTLKMDGYKDQTLRVIGEWKYISKYRDQNCTAGPRSTSLTAFMEKDNAFMLTEETLDIHWGIDSDPVGARVFWKVTSSIPSIVKGNDFIYLGATPIDTTKPLNIKGLNSENAKNVKIEIKIQLKGYKTQTKTFSAEHLTEQQEIGWFFELEEE